MITAGPEELWISTRGMVEGRGCGCGRMSKVRSTCFGYAGINDADPGSACTPRVYLCPPGGNDRCAAFDYDEEQVQLLGIQITYERHQNSSRLGENVSGVTVAALNFVPLPSG